MKIIIFLIGLLFGVGLGFGISNMVKLKKEPTIGELGSVNDGGRTVLYLELLNEESLELAKNHNTVRLIVKDSLHTH